MPRLARLVGVLLRLQAGRCNQITSWRGRWRHLFVLWTHTLVCPPFQCGSNLLGQVRQGTHSHLACRVGSVYGWVSCPC